MPLGLHCALEHCIHIHFSLMQSHQRSIHTCFSALYRSFANLSAFLLVCRMVVGCTLAVLGFTMYSYASLEAQQRRTLTVLTKPGASPDASLGNVGLQTSSSSPLSVS